MYSLVVLKVLAEHGVLSAEAGSLLCRLWAELASQMCSDPLGSVKSSSVIFLASRLPFPLTGLRGRELRFSDLVLLGVIIIIDLY